MYSFLDWAVANKVELSGTIFGLVYIWFSIRQSLFTWPAGIITSLLYCLVFFEAKFYAGMGLQVYYVIISLYGWWSWNRGVNSSSGIRELHVTYSNSSSWIQTIVLNLLLTFLLYYLLIRYTDSPVPLGDAFTTSLSIIATWMLARKKIENWLIWIICDFVSIGLYLYRGLYSTVFLFVVYTIMAGIGFFEWQKDLKLDRVNQ